MPTLRSYLSCRPTIQLFFVASYPLSSILHKFTIYSQVSSFIIHHYFQTINHTWLTWLVRVTHRFTASELQGSGLRVYQEFPAASNGMVVDVGHGSNASFNSNCRYTPMTLFISFNSTVIWPSSLTLPTINRFSFTMKVLASKNSVRLPTSGGR